MKFAVKILALVLPLISLCGCGSNEENFSGLNAPAPNPIHSGYNGWARCTGEPNLVIHNTPNPEDNSKNTHKAVCNLGERAYVEGTVIARNGRLYAKLPGWGSGIDAVNHRQYGYADAAWLQIENAVQDKGQSFAAKYIANYDTITAKVKVFYPSSPVNACAAYASTALKFAGFNIAQVTVTNDVEAQLKARGWPAINNMAALHKGDVVFTDQATSNIPGTWSHVFVFQGYTDSTHGYATDNQHKYYLRNLGAGEYSRAIKAYRPK